MENKSFGWWMIFVLLCIWQLPQFLVSLVMIPFLGRLRLAADRHYNLCFEGEEMNGGISLGPLSFVSPWSAKSKESIAHEVDGHTWQSRWYGPLYLFVWGIPSIFNAMFDITKCYYDFYTERSANKHAGLEVDEFCRLRFK